MTENTTGIAQQGLSRGRSPALSSVAIANQ